MLKKKTSLRSLIGCDSFCIQLVYSQCTGNIIGTKQQSYGPATSRFAIDGDASTCFKAKTGRDRFWSVNLGENVRVARVFMLFHGKFEWKNTSIDIGKYSFLLIPSFCLFVCFLVFCFPVRSFQLLVYRRSSMYCVLL